MPGLLASFTTLARRGPACTLVLPGNHPHPREPVVRPLLRPCDRPERQCRQHEERGKQRDARMVGEPSLPGRCPYGGNEQRDDGKRWRAGDEGAQERSSATDLTPIASDDRQP